MCSAEQKLVLWTSATENAFSTKSRGQPLELLDKGPMETKIFRFPIKADVYLLILWLNEEGRKT